MPSYNYKCLTCEHIYTKILTFTEYDKFIPEKEKCEECGKKGLAQTILTAPAFTTPNTTEARKTRGKG